MSSSSSSSGNIFLENIAQFRDYSLDPALIEKYFNKGPYAIEVDLDIFQNSSSSESSSSSSGFSILIDLIRLTRDPLGIPYTFPNLSFYVYDEKVNGSDISGSIQVSQISGTNQVLVQLDSYIPDGASEFSFQLNIEHPSISTERTKFVFRQNKTYHYEIGLSRGILNEPKRLSPLYSAYLLNWINQFWAAYDANDFNLVPNFTRPIANQNTEFDPFYHARWEIIYGQNSTQELFSLETYPAPGNTGLVNGWNFLGVSQSIWDCIITGGLYQNYLRTKIGESFDGIISNDEEEKAYADNFDCRSFTHAALNFLEPQLKEICPEAKVSYLYVREKGVRAHALVWVELGGAEGDSCCEGSFVYEPQDGTTFSKEDYCKKYPKFCEPGSWEESKDGVDIGERDPDWEKSAAERDRIKGVICGCLTESSYPAGTAESLIKNKCDAPDGTFQTWFRVAYAFEPTDTSEKLVPEMPQILSCEKSLCLSSRDEATNSPCLIDAQGLYEPYVCDYNCICKWSCSLNNDGTCIEYCSTGGTLGEYETRTECEIWCAQGAWCSIDSTTLDKTGECKEGTKKNWTIDDDNKVAGDFKLGKSCGELDCQSEEKIRVLYFEDEIDYLCATLKCTPGCCESTGLSAYCRC